MTKRVVAIVGRPNIGKSAIFNRLAGRRIAIVHEQSGVTRDRLMREVSWSDERFELIDTGGIANIDGERQDKINEGIRQQVDAALEDATVAILAVDVTAGVVPMDEEVADILRGSSMKVVVAVNKCDHKERDGDASDFDRLGFPSFPVSALHDRGFDAMMDEVVEMLPEEENPTTVEPLKVAVVGRPNVGKSSYVNRLLKNDRVIVSDIPGTTRDCIDVPFTVGKGDQARHYQLIDTAGIRRVGKIDNSVERFSRFRAEQTVEHADVVVLILDASKGPTAQDKKIAALVQEHRKGCVVVVNKWDLQSQTQRQYGPQVSRSMPFMEFCPLVFISAKDGYNIRRSVDAIDHVAAQVKTELPTGILNRTIQDAYDRVHPPAIKGARLKIYYCAQVGVSPVRVKLFVNNPKLVRDAYRSYLVKTLRRKFGLEGAPIVLHFSARKRDRKK